VHDDALSTEQRRALLALTPAAERGFYLAGGSALCLRLAHRRSVDLDLFHTGQFDADQLLRELRAAGVPAHNATTQRSTLWFELDGVETSLMYFDYPPLEQAESGLGVPIASLVDIAAMKIEAIASRGARKDFVDLYFICQEQGLGLTGALAAFEARFASAQPDVLHRVKALTYFEDAEREPELLMLKPIDWAKVREYFEREAQAWWKATAP
jgi:Nucleotidyl transferase AbiEii toxin, Type IV TA system